MPSEQWTFNTTLSWLWALKKFLDHAAAVLSVIHDTPLNGLQIVVGLGLHARMLHEREKDVQADLKLAFARFG